MDIHLILREYMEEIRSGILEDPDQSVTAGGPSQQQPSGEPSPGGQGSSRQGAEDPNQIMES